MRFSFVASLLRAVQNDILVFDCGIRDHRPALNPVKQPALSVKVVEMRSMILINIKLRPRRTARHLTTVNFFTIDGCD
jgi:hypothetical protein